VSDVEQVPAARPGQDRGGSRWHALPERGSPIMVSVLVAIARWLGRRAAGVVLYGIAVWYVALHPGVRRSSRDFLRRVKGRGTLRDVYRNVLAFSRVALDRIWLVSGDYRAFDIHVEGGEHLLALRDGGKGALLLMAHLGSFEAMRTLGRDNDFRVAMLGYFKNTERLNAVIQRFDRSGQTALIGIRPGDPSAVLEVEERIGRGEVVGTMADRVGFDARVARVPFLGGEACFPTGPYLLAHALRCPAYLCFALFRAPNRYELHCEPFADAIVLPRGAAREEAVKALAARYAVRLEHYCRAYPDNWFNFYDFWASAPPAPGAPPEAA